jgi:hypothetical protein
MQVTRAVATLARTPARLDLQLGSSLGLTTVNVQTMITPGDDFALDLVADTVLFAELHPFEGKLPKIGTAKLSLSASRTGDALRVDVRRATALIGASHAAARGRIDTGAHGVVNGLVLQVNNLRPEDMQRAFGFELPGDGPYSGRITADGVLKTGVRVEGAIEGRATGAPSRVALAGTVHADPHAAFDLQLRGDPIRLADTAFTMNLRARGPLDTLGIRGDVQLLRAPARRPVVLAENGQPDAPDPLLSATAQVNLLFVKPAGAPGRQLRGYALLHEAAAERAEAMAAPYARAEGMITFGPRPTVDAQITADSLPLSVLPWPREIEDVGGHLRGGFRLNGPLSDPAAHGELRVLNGSLHARTPDITLTHITGPLRLRGDRLMLDPLTANVKEGTLRASGDVFPVGAHKRVALAVHADAVPIMSREPLHTASGDVRVLGPLDSARASGNIEIVHSASGHTSATARGSAVLNRNGALQVDIAADSLPLKTLPLQTDQVTDIGGSVRGRLALRGTMADPLLEGVLQMFGGEGRVRASGTHLRAVNGQLRVENNVLHTDGLRGRAGPGTVALSGSAHLRGARSLDLKFQADSAQVADTDSASIIASAALAITGTLNLPRVTGRARLVGGWAKENLMKSDPVVDLEEPPHADLAARVPWIANSRILRTREPAKRHPAFLGDIVVEVTPGIKMVDEDSELYGRGEVRVRADSTGITAAGDVRFLGGHYNNFGERFRVRGGGFVLTENEDPRIALRAEHELDKLGGRDFGNSSPLAWYPGLELLTVGTTKTAVEQLRRLTPLPQAQTELAATLIYDQPFDPITGWYNPQFWLPDKPSDFVGKRTEQQGGDLLWSYVADEAYDYLPLSRAALFAGTVTIGSRFPGRIVQGPLFQTRITINRKLDLVTSLATEGSAYPGLRARWYQGPLSFVAFHEPRFFAAIPSGDFSHGYFFRRRTGFGLRWEREY